MTEQMPRLLIDVGNTAIKWRLANADGLLDTGVQSRMCRAYATLLRAKTGV